MLLCLSELSYMPDERGVDDAYYNTMHWANKVDNITSIAGILGTSYAVGIWWRLL